MTGNDVTDHGVRVHLNGGLGNQLFQVVAGKVVADRVNCPLVLDTSWVRLFHDRVGILGLGPLGPTVRTSLRLPRIADPVNFRWTTRRQRQSQRAAGFSLTSAAELLQFVAEPTEEPDIALIGYFQSAHVVSMLHERHLPSLRTLRHPSSWFRTMSERVRIEAPVMVHVRRGDFVGDPRWGDLSPGYYDAALSLVEQAGDRPLWLFSDDPAGAAETLRSIRVRPFEVIMPPARHSCAAEGLVLMSRGSAVVTANSTFSWWAGYLCSGEVCAPEPFHPPQTQDQRAEVTDLSHPRWNMIPVDWNAGFL